MVIEIIFNSKLYELHNDEKSVLLPKEEYNNIINHIKKISQKKMAHDYYLLKKYEILQCGNVEKLIRKREDGEQNPIYFVTIEEMFDAIKQMHINTGHGGRDKLIKEISKTFANITHESLNLFKTLCVQGSSSKAHYI